MSKPKMGLGRGLDALINPHARESNDRPLTVPTKDIRKDDGKSYDILVKVPVKLIDPNPYQPRLVFEPKALEELKKSILENGLIQPITVRRAPDERYELISGERRLRACIQIGYKEIPAYIILVETKEAMLALSLIENIQREKLNQIEIAQAYKRLMEECHLSQEEIAKSVGKDRTTVTNTIRLLKLPEELQHGLINDEISAGHARALINLPSAKVQIKFFDMVKKDNLSVRKVEQLVKKYIESPGSGKSNKKNSVSAKDINTLSKNDLENKLRQIFGTKVLCTQKKDGTGAISIEFYSNDELERLLELFAIIENNY